MGLPEAHRGLARATLGVGVGRNQTEWFEEWKVKKWIHGA